MILASHNSLTYLKPKNPLAYLFRWMYRCQKKTIQEQYVAGVRFFDFRLSYDRNGNLEFRHGLVPFKTPKNMLDSILKYLNATNDVTIRVVLERSKWGADDILFELDCKRMEYLYTNIRFTCGENVKTKEVVYEFKRHSDKPVYEKYSSVLGSKLNGAWPWRFAKKHNKEFIEEYKDKDCYLMMDFI